MKKIFTVSLIAFIISLFSVASTYANNMINQSSDTAKNTIQRTEM